LSQLPTHSLSAFVLTSLQFFFIMLCRNVIVPSGLRNSSETMSQIFASTSQGIEKQSSNLLKTFSSSPFEIINKEKNFRQYLRWLRLKVWYFLCSIKYKNRKNLRESKTGIVYYITFSSWRWIIQSMY
jgi:hypothetical protein